MGFLDRIVAGAEFRVASGVMNPAGWLLDAFSTNAVASGERVTRRSAMGLAAVFSAVEKISEAVGSLPFKVYRVVDDGDRVEARSHRSWRMLHDKPNDETTAHTFWSTVTAQLLLDGNSFVWKDRNEVTGEVESLYLLDPTTVTIEWDGRRKLFVQNYSGGKRTFTNEQVLHIMGFSLDGVVGCSRITYCREALGTAQARSRFEGEFYAQGAHFPGHIEYPGRLGAAGTENLGKAMATKHGGPGNRHKVPVLEEGATFKIDGMSLADMQFVENAQMSRADIATMFNLPASYLNASSGDSLTYATTESNQIQFAQMAIAPITSRIAKAVSSDPGILPQNVMYAEHTLEGLLRADMKTRAEYWASMKSTLGLSPEFIAGRENIPQDALEEPEPVPAPLQIEPPMMAEDTPPADVLRLAQR
jgi:HK97 family phage portal protein